MDIGDNLDSKKLLGLILIILGIIFLAIRKFIRKKSVNMSKDELINEVANLHEQIEKLMKEKDELMAMKVSQLGINPDEKGKDKKKDGKNENQEELVDEGEE